jgi:hypothetical protein
MGSRAKSRTVEFENVYEVDFDSPGCVHGRCRERVVVESGRSRLCLWHWAELRAKCELLRMRFDATR